MHGAAVAVVTAVAATTAVAGVPRRSATAVAATEHGNGNRQDGGAIRSTTSAAAEGAQTAGPAGEGGRGGTASGAATVSSAAAATAAAAEAETAAVTVRRRSGRRRSRVTSIGDVRTWPKLVNRRMDKEGRGSRFVGDMEEELPTLLPGSGRDTRCAPTIVMRRAGGVLQRYGLQESPRWATGYSVMYVD